MSTQADIYHRLSGRIFHETEKAIYFKASEVDNVEVEAPKKEWFPLSQVKSITRAAEPGPEDEPMEPDMIEVKAWIVKSKGLI